MRADREVVEVRGGHRFIRLKGGRLVGFWDMIRAAEGSLTDVQRAVSRALRLAKAHDDRELRAYDLERLEWFIDGLEEYAAAVRGVLEKERGIKTREERIALLRQTTGRTEAEAEAFRRKADQLEAEMRST